MRLAGDALTGMKIHPITNCYPMMSVAELGGLIADISKRGLLYPVTVQAGTLLDGRNRVEACKVAGVPLRTVEYVGDDAAGFIHSTNERRDLTVGQRAMIAAKVANLPHGGDRRSDQAAKPPLGTQAAVAATLNVPERTVRAAKAVLDADPDLAERVAQGKVKVYSAESTVRGKTRNAARRAVEAAAAESPKRNKPLAERVQQITDLLAAGHNKDQIAEIIGVRADYVSQMAKKHAIPTPPHSLTRKGNAPISAATIITETVNSLTGLTQGVQLAKTRKLVMTREQASELLREARESLKSINWIINALREITNA